MRIKHKWAWILCVIYVLCFITLAACNKVEDESAMPPYYQQLQHSIGKPWEDVVKQLGMNPENATEYGNGFYIILPEKPEFDGYPMYVVLQIQPDFRDNPGTVLSFSYYYEYTGDNKDAMFRAAAEDVFKLRESYIQRYGAAKPTYTTPLGNNAQELYEAFSNPKQTMEIAQIGEWDLPEGLTFGAAVRPYQENKMILALSCYPTP